MRAADGLTKERCRAQHMRERPLRTMPDRVPSGARLIDRVCAAPYNSAMSVDLSGKRVLVLGAETEVGRAVASAVAEAGASVAAVAATSGAEAAFAVQRLVRRLSSGDRKVIAQAIDARNEMAVRVMVRQVSKELAGLDAIVVSADSFDETMFEEVIRYGGRELGRSGEQGRILIVSPPHEDEAFLSDLFFREHTGRPRWWLSFWDSKELGSEDLVEAMLKAIAEPLSTG